jgi:membrane protease YdiL (CAAX protease family)
MISSPRLIFLLFMVVLVCQLSVGWLMDSIGLNLSFAVNQGIVMAVLPILIIRIAGKKLGFNLKAPSYRFILAVLFPALALAVIIAYLQAATEYIINVPPEIGVEAKKLLEASTIRGFLTKVVCIALLPSLGEEIFFRGICQTAISARYGNRLGIIIAAGLFTIIHANPWYVHYYFISGCFFGWIYMAGRTLWLPIICHFANNFLAITIDYVGVKLPTGIPVLDATIVVCAVAVFILMIYQLKTLVSQR